MVNFLLAQLWFSSLDFFSSHSCRLNRIFFRFFFCLSTHVVLFIRTKVVLFISKFSKYIEREDSRATLILSTDNFLKKLWSSSWAIFGKTMQCTSHFLEKILTFSRVILQSKPDPFIGNFLEHTWSSSYEFFCHKCDSLHQNFSRAQQSSSQEFSALYCPSTRYIFYGRSAPLYRNKCC